LGKRILSEMY